MLSGVQRFSIPFAYDVAPELRAEFEAVYGPEGRWAQFFRSDPAYIETTLERTGDGEYLVTDHWRTRGDYERFLERNAARYEELSRAGERIYASERRLPAT
jgi:hypothetical protein